MKRNLSYINYSWLVVLIFLVVFAIGQFIFVHYWTQDFKNVDIFELIVAPSCCFALASCIGVYRNKWLSLISLPSCYLLGHVFYVLFQKMTFFKDSELIALFSTNIKLLGLIFFINFMVATLISYIFLYRRMSKNHITIAQEMKADPE